MSDVKKRIIDYDTITETDENYYLLADHGTEGTFKIPVKAVGPIESICPFYDAEAGTYDEGDYCFYAQKMYQCNTDISVPEDFDSTKWDEVTIAEIVASQQSQISEVNASLTNLVTQVGGVRLKVFNNAVKYEFELGFTPEANKYAMFVIMNANQDSIFRCNVSNTITVGTWQGTRSITASLSGTKLTITPSSTMWGTSIVLWASNQTL